MGDQITIQDQSSSIQQLEDDKTKLKEQLAELLQKVDCMDVDTASNLTMKKMGRQLRDLKEDYATLQGKESDLLQKNGDLEKQIEVSDVEVLTLKGDLKLAMKRIEDLQVAISGDIDSESFSDHVVSEDSDDESGVMNHFSQLTLNSHHDIRSPSQSVLSD